MTSSATMTELPSTAGGYWIYRQRPMRESLIDAQVDASGMIQNGKWMLFYNKNRLDFWWVKACELFDAGRFGDQIISMKVSTSLANSRSSDDTKGVIVIFTPTAHKDDILKWGSMIQEAMDYGDAMYFKTEAQTHAGTGATGQLTNHTLSIPRRNHWPYMSASENRAY